MSIPRIDLLIKDTRVMSLEQDYGDDYGIGQEFFLIATNNANLVIQRFILAENSKAFGDYADTTTTAQTSDYAQPSNIFCHDAIYSVSYSDTGLEQDFEELDLMYRREYYGTSCPSQWVAINGRIYLDGDTTAGGILRVEYEKRLDRLELRRGRVKTVTINGAGSLVTALNVDPLETDTDATALAAAEYLCIVDAYGTVKARNIKVSSYDSSTGDLTLSPGGSVVEAGSTIDVGDYVLAKPDSTTHSPLPDMIEDFFIGSIKNEVYEHVSEAENTLTDNKLERILSKIAEIYSQQPRGKAPIPQTGGGY